MKIDFLSYYIDLNTPVYGGVKDQIKIDYPRRINRGDHVNTSLLSFPNHIGTHIDFPFHFSNDGKKIDDYPPEFWIFNNVGFVNSDFDNLENNLSKVSPEIEFLIVKTGFGALRGKDSYWKEQPVIRSTIAPLLRQKFNNLKVLGFDMISLTSQLDKNEGKKAHMSFLIDNDILIIEDMKLDKLFSKPNRLIVSPFNVSNMDGSPCTIFCFY